MKRLIAVLSFLLVSGVAHADNIRELMSLGMPGGLASKVDAIYSSASAASHLPKTDNTYDLGSASKQWRNVYIGTKAVYAAGANAQLTGYVPTLVATPVAGTNVFQPGLNIVPTVAANTAAFIGPATPVPGQQFTIVNTGPNAVRAKAAGGATLNGATAGGYIAIASLATVDCVTTSTGNQSCRQPVIPTPAGP